MHKALENLSITLDGLAKAIIAGKPDSNTFAAQFGWNAPAISSAQAADLASQFISLIKSSNVESLTKEQEQNIALCQSSIVAFQNTSLPYFFNGNIAGAYPTYLALIESIRNVIERIHGWQNVPKANSIPAALARKLESIEASIDNIVIDRERLTSKVSLINEAAETAEALPITLKQLNETKASLDRSAGTASEYIGKMQTLHEQSDQTLLAIRENASEAATLAKQSSEAYAATTSIGLGGAFEAEAKSLVLSIRFWVVGLVVALFAGAVVGYIRFPQLSQALSTSKSDPIIIVVELTISILSLGLPLWFAWMATKQIQERFKLSQDYAFKANVAKAYEGYRREAVRFDSKIEERLFVAALQRLEQEPLRLVDPKTYPSPYHESGILSAATDTALEFKAIGVKAVKEKLGLGKAEGE